MKTSWIGNGFTKLALYTCTCGQIDWGYYLYSWRPGEMVAHAVIGLAVQLGEFTDRPAPAGSTLPGHLSEAGVTNPWTVYGASLLYCSQPLSLCSLPAMDGVPFMISEKFACAPEAVGYLHWHPRGGGGPHKVQALVMPVQGAATGA